MVAVDYKRVKNHFHVSFFNFHFVTSSQVTHFIFQRKYTTHKKLNLSFHQKHKKIVYDTFFPKAFFSLFFSGCYFLSTLFPTISTCITASLYYPDSGSILSTFPFLASSLKHTYYFPLPLFLPPSHFPSQPFPGSIREPSTPKQKTGHYMITGLV